MPQSRNRILVGLLVLATNIGCIVALNMLQTTPRFEYPPLNYAAIIALALALPTILFWFAFFVLSKGWRWAVVVVASLISVPICIFVLLASIVLQNVASTGVDYSFEPIAEIRGEHVSHRLYRTNGGATTAFGIVLRKEIPLPLGLKLVTLVRGYYPARDATLERLPSGQARLRVEPYTPGGKGESFEFNP